MASAKCSVSLNTATGIIDSIQNENEEGKLHTITTIITNTFLEYNSRMEIREDSRVEHPISYYQRILTKYFVGFYPYPTPKYKIKVEMNPRRFHRTLYMRVLILLL